MSIGSSNNGFWFGLGFCLGFFCWGFFRVLFLVLFSKRAFYMEKNSSNRQSKSVSEPVSVTDLGWKAAACCSSSAIRYSFSGCL